MWFLLDSVIWPIFCQVRTCVSEIMHKRNYGSIKTILIIWRGEIHNPLGFNKCLLLFVFIREKFIFIYFTKDNEKTTIDKAWEQNRIYIFLTLLSLYLYSPWISSLRKVSSLFAVKVIHFFHFLRKVSLLFLKENIHFTIINTMPIHCLSQFLVISF